MGGQRDWILMSTCVIMFLVSPTLAALPSQPLNLTITKLHARYVTITWDFPPSDDVTKFEMTYRTGDLGHRHSVLMALNKHVRSHSLDNLEPNTNYEVFIIAYNAEGMGNVSSHVVFRTPSATAEIERMRTQMNVGEVILVILLLVGWLTTIGLFLNKWGQIRSFQPREPRFKHNPKNLHTIQVVDHATDSVIYKTYTRKLSKTMQAREKRLARMRTVPNIKILSDDSLFKDSSEMPPVQEQTAEDVGEPRRRSSSVTAIDKIPGRGLATPLDDRSRKKSGDSSATHLRPVSTKRPSSAGSAGAASGDNLKQTAAGPATTDARLPNNHNNEKVSLKNAPDVSTLEQGVTTTGDSSDPHFSTPEQCAIATGKSSSSQIKDRTAKQIHTSGRDGTNSKLDKKDRCKDTVNVGINGSSATDSLQSTKKQRKHPDSKYGPTPVLDQVALVSKTYPNDPNYANNDMTSSNPPKVTFSSVPFLELDEAVGGGSPV